MAQEQSAEAVAAFFRENEQKDLLRVLSAGSVDDGKSTLIGRLLYDSKTLFEDHLAALERDSKRHGSAGEDIDYALLLDGLKAEREQGITIDVAYRYFATPKRKFIIADTPGHEQYTRNMVTGGSTADMAIILIDARNGILQQTRRHTFIASLLGIKHLLVAVNKMDLVDFREDVYQEICRDYVDFTAKLSLSDVQFIPISALKGDNVTVASPHMAWYGGPSLLQHLETVHVASDRNLVDFRMPVQLVLRPNLNFRGFCGTIVSGTIRQGDEVLVLPSGQRSRVRSLVSPDGELPEAHPPMAMCVTLEDEVDVSRGNMLVHVHNVPRLERRVEAVVVWMGEEPSRVGLPYLVKHTTNLVPATLTKLRYRINVNTLHREESQGLELNEIGRAVLQFHHPLPHDAYARNRGTGSFIIIDRLTNATVGAGMILEHETNQWVAEQAEEAHDENRNVHPHQSLVQEADRAERLKQKGATVWLTGLPKAGKSTLAFALEKRLFGLGWLPHVLDGENLRLGVSHDLSFSADDRSENVRRAAAVARLCNQAGLITIAAFVSPYADDRTKASQTIGHERFLEVHVAASLAACRTRDDEGLYDRADKGEIRNFSGVSSPYEEPENPDVRVDTEALDVDACVDLIVVVLRERGLIQ